MKFNNDINDINSSLLKSKTLINVSKKYDEEMFLFS